VTGKVDEGGDGDFIGVNDLENLKKKKWKRYR
jgi:hypothetical protein